MSLQIPDCLIRLRLLLGFLLLLLMDHWYRDAALLLLLLLRQRSGRGQSVFLSHFHTGRYLVGCSLACIGSLDCGLRGLPSRFRFHLARGLCCLARHGFALCILRHLLSGPSLPARLLA